MTLTGPGGVGKTRLALQVPHDLIEQFADGIAFISLAPITDSTLVLPAIAQVLGVREAGEEPLVTRLTAFLRHKQALLVLDNFEQVVEAAPLVADLLAACPELRMLATSRVRLRVSGEREYAVPPLGLVEHVAPAPLDEVAESEAARLFVERARTVREDFALTAENAPAVAAICARLDGLPLAIELAAARVKVLPPATLLSRMERRLPLLTGGGRDAPARQRTMRDAIAWSHDLLTPGEQILFRRLAVFVGGFDLEAAEAVAGGPDAPGLDVLDGICSLVDQSLLREEDDPDGEPRYRMLETAREFGLERLNASGEEATVRDRHAAWCLTLAEAAGAVLRTTYDPGVVARLEAEHPNLRAALVWFAQASDGEALVRIGATLGRFWYVAGHAREGRGWLERALALAPAAPTPARARALLNAGLLTLGLGDAEAAFRDHEAAAALARELGLGEEEAVGELGQGVALQYRGEYDAAEVRFAAALPRFRQAGKGVYELATTYHLGVVAHGRGEAGRARRLWEETLAEARARGELVFVAWCLELLGLLAAEQGDLRGAAAALGERLAVGRSVLHRHHRGELLATLAVLGDACGQVEAAARLLGAAETAEAAQHFDPPVGLACARAAERLRQALGAAAYERALAAGRGQGPEAVEADARAVLDAAAASGAAETARPDPADAHGLTPRERDVLRLLVEGCSDREIAEALGLRYRTVTSYVRNILTRLDVTSRTAAATYAVRHGLV